MAEIVSMGQATSRALGKASLAGLRDLMYRADLEPSLHLSTHPVGTSSVDESCHMPALTTAQLGTEPWPPGLSHTLRTMSDT